MNVMCAASRQPEAPAPARRRWLASGAALAGLGWAGLLTVTATVTVPMAGCSAGFKGVNISGADYGRDFHLPDMNGRMRRLADFRGQVVMLYFGFTQCPDVCPTALGRAQSVMHLLGPQAEQKVQLLFVSVDPERDTPELLRAYMAAFHPRFLALRGNTEQTQATAQAFRIFYQKVPTGSSYTMDHAAQTYLFDPQGRLRVMLGHHQTDEEYAADIQRLLAGA